MNCNTSVDVPAAYTASNARTRSFRVEFVSLFVCLLLYLFVCFPSLNNKKRSKFSQRINANYYFFSSERPLVVGSTHDDRSTDDLRNVGN